MIKAFLLLTISICFVVLNVPAQSKKRPPKPVPKVATNTVGDFLGEISGDKYINRYFRFNVEIPDGAVVLNKAEIDLYSKAGADLLKGNNQRNNKALDAAFRDQAALIMISQKQPGQPGNAVIEISVRKQQPRVTANMVLSESVKLMTATGKSVLVASSTKRIGGTQAFTTADLETLLNGQKLNQTALVTMQKGYGLSIGLTSSTPEGLEWLESMLEKITFSNK